MIPISNPDCSCCKTERVNSGKVPRQMISAQVEGAKKPYFFCTYCDGDAVVLAKVLEAERLAGS